MRIWKMSRTQKPDLKVRMMIEAFGIKFGLAFGVWGLQYEDLRLKELRSSAQKSVRCSGFGYEPSGIICRTIPSRPYFTKTFNLTID